jgi:hypothetical protein
MRSVKALQKRDRWVVATFDRRRYALEGRQQSMYLAIPTPGAPAGTLARLLRVLLHHLLLLRIVVG